jgi:hypothetical protein
MVESTSVIVFFTDAVGVYSVPIVVVMVDQLNYGGLIGSPALSQCSKSSP